MGAGVDFARQDHYRQIRTADVLPIADGTGEDRGQLVQCQLRKRISGMDHHGQPIQCHDDLFGLEALLFGHGDLLGLQLAREFGDVACVGKHGGDARARTAAGDGHRHIAIHFHEFFGPGLAQVDHGVRALDLERIGLLPLPAAAGEPEAQRQAKAYCQKYPFFLCHFFLLEI